MKRTLKPIFPPAGIEREYEKRLKKAVREMEKSVVYWLSARYKANESKILDSATDDILKAFRRLLRQWTRNFNELCETLPRWFVSKIREYTARNLVEQTRPLRDAGLGFNLKFSYMSQAERQVFQAIVSENVNLIKSIARESLTQVEGIVLRGITSGNDLATVTEQLHHQFGVSERRAAMIARDQTNKATNNLSRQRLLDYGVTKGIWLHTASGKTYRETHENDMNGQEYDIREGCFDPDEKVNRNIQPAELVNCYCVCRPVIPQLSEEETEQGIEEIFNELGEPMPETPKAETAETQGEKQDFGFVPANTIKEADAYIVDNYGINTSWKGVDLEVANDFNKGYTEYFARFPELQKNFEFVGEHAERRALIRQNIIDSFIKNTNGKYADEPDFLKREAKRYADKIMRAGFPSAGDRVIAQSFGDVRIAEYDGGLRGIVANKKQCANAAKLKESLARSVESKFHPVGCDTIRSVLDHEMGHQIDQLLDLRNTPEFKNIYNSLLESQITDRLSQYATTDKGEFIAEAWAEYCNNPKPRKIAKEVGELIEMLYKKKFGRG